MSYHDDWLDDVVITPFDESIQNNLPAWSDSILPVERLNHIVSNHTIQGRVGHMLPFVEDEVREEFSLHEGDWADISIHVPRKLENGATLNEIEEYVVMLISMRDKKDHFPRSMTREQIKDAIRHAYRVAEKIGSRQLSPTSRDMDNIGIASKGSHLYQGQFGKMRIRFWFNFDSSTIRTAYPKFK